MKKKLKSLLKLALPYAVTIFLPILSTLFLSKTVVSNFQEKIVNEKQKSIEASFNRFLRKIDAIEQLMYTIAKSDELGEYVNVTKMERGHSVSEYMAVKNMLSSLMIDSNVMAIYYYDHVDGRIITNDASYSQVESYFSHRYQIEDYTVEEYVKNLQDLTRGRGYGSKISAKFDKASVEVIEYKMTVPMALNSMLKGQLVMIIDASELFYDITEILEANSELYIYDSNDVLIYSNGNQFEDMFEVVTEDGLQQIEVGEKTVWHMVCGSDNSYWKAKVYIPELIGDIYNKEMSFYRTVYGIIPILISVCLCMYFTIKNYGEICEILKLFVSHKEVSDHGKADVQEIGYQHIQEEIKRLMREKDELGNKISLFEQSHKYEILDKLIRNTYREKGCFKEELKKANLSIADGKSVVLCIRYRSSDYRAMVTENISIKDFVRELLYQHIERKAEIFDTSARETICIFSLAEEDEIENVMRNILSIINVEIAYNYGIELEIGIGNAVDSLSKISESYAQAKEVISYNETSGNIVCMYSELEKTEDIYYYPMEYDEKLYNYIMTGKHEAAKDIACCIYKENFEGNRKNLSENAVKKIKERLEKTILLPAERNDILVSEIKLKLDNTQNIKEYFDIIFYAINNISENLNSRKKYTQNQSAMKIMSYIKEHYCDNELSLKQISSIFGFTEHYISDLFKNVYGEKFSASIEKMRIEKACEIIKSGDLKIHEIAESVGYTSDASFRRAFKKVTGIAPSEYKDI